MAIKNNPDGTYQIDTPGYGHLLFKKLYSHPKSRKTLDSAVLRAHELGVLLPSLEEAIALRCAANGQYAADQPQLTRTSLWQFFEHNTPHIAHTSPFDFYENIVMREWASFAHGFVSFAWEDATERQRQTIRTVHAFAQTQLRYTIRLEDLARNPLVRTLLGESREPYAELLRAEGYDSIHLILPEIPVDFDKIKVSHAVLGQENNLFFDGTIGFCQGVRRKEIPYEKALSCKRSQ